MALSYYKNHAAPRRPCVICGIRTQGPTSDTYLAHDVHVWLCTEHASPAFARSRSGRDCRLSLQQALRAAGRLTRQHERAIDAYVDRHLRPPAPPSGRARPGSYAWAAIRQRLEDVLAKGTLSIAKIVELVHGWLKSELRRGLVTMPSRRTLRRWRYERRWADTPTTPPT